MSGNHGKKWLRFFVFRALILINIILVLAADGFLGRMCSVLLAFFSLYSWFWFYHGYKDKVIEDDENGYVGDGLKMMFKSWFWLVVIVVLLQTCTA